MKDSRLIVVSNRLPVTICRSGSQIEVRKSCGGLVTALEPLLRRSGGYWIGWPGSECTPEISRCLDALVNEPFQLRPVYIAQEEHSDFYNGCSNQIIWPLFHDNLSACRFDPAYWESYRSVSEYFADAIESTATPRDFVWVHDYHLMLVAGSLRARDSRLKLAYFHHIPFPEPEIFGRLPWRVELLSSLLKFNNLGFQTQRDRRNFVASLRRWLPGSVRVRRLGANWLVSANDRTCIVAASPISVDFECFSSANDAEVAAECEQLRYQMAFQSLILGVDRLDYTKGILERLQAFRLFLEQNPDQCGVATLIQLVIPSREEIESYRELRRRIEQLVGEINGHYGRPGWTPVHYMYRGISRNELIALYRCATAALVTPLRDGMNLVAKEFCASRNDGSGVLILSEFAGAAEELACGALIVNPNDIQQIADALRDATNMTESEKRQRMTRMRDAIRAHDVWYWSTRLCAGEFSSRRPVEASVTVPTTAHKAFANAASRIAASFQDIEIARA